MLDGLKAWYLDSLKGYGDAIRSAAAALRDGNAEAAVSLRRIAHSLRGSGGSYGYPEISAAAAAVEDAGSDLARVDAAATALVAALDEVCSRAENPNSTILVVDDDPAIRELMRAGLSAANRSVLTVGSVGEARSAFAQSTISLVLLDLAMPEDGRNLLVDLRRSARTAAVPVVVLTAAARGCWACRLRQGQRGWSSVRAGPARRLGPRSAAPSPLRTRAESGSSAARIVHDTPARSLRARAS